MGTELLELRVGHTFDVERRLEEAEGKLAEAKRKLEESRKERERAIERLRAMGVSEDEIAAVFAPEE